MTQETRTGLINRRSVLVANQTLSELRPASPFIAGRLFGTVAGTAARR
jgi:hypothetical protein